ncbi:MAG: aspartate carbamoyltransferase regulatory subunit [Candidatus Diapherotrites archaeon]
MVKKMEQGLYLKPIDKGTTIDHLPVGTALKVLKIVGEGKGAVTVAIRVPSHKMGLKDLVFIEDRFLSKEECDKIALVARNATINHIIGGEVKQKLRLSLPREVTGILECINPKCITNVEGLPGRFFISDNPETAKCFYCERKMNHEEIASRIKV